MWLIAWRFWRVNPAVPWQPPSPVHQSSRDVTTSSFILIRSQHQIEVFLPKEANKTTEKYDEQHTYKSHGSSAKQFVSYCKFSNCSWDKASAPITLALRGQETVKCHRAEQRNPSRVEYKAKQTRNTSRQWPSWMILSVEIQETWVEWQMICNDYMI